MQSYAKFMRSTGLWRADKCMVQVADAVGPVRSVARCELPSQEILVFKYAAIPSFPIFRVHPFSVSPFFDNYTSISQSLLYSNFTTNYLTQCLTHMTIPLPLLPQQTGQPLLQLQRRASRSMTEISSTGRTV